VPFFYDAFISRAGKMVFRLRFALREKMNLALNLRSKK
jgi:hypothetical protein